MRRLDDTPLDPEMEATLDAIDATLAGEPVDPRFAEVAELALLLADERPRLRPEFAGELDARVERRFAPAPSASQSWGYSSARTRRRWSWARIGSGAFATAAVGALVAVVVVLGNSPSGGSSSSYSAASSSSSSAAASVPAAGSPSLDSATSAASSSSGSTGQLRAGVKAPHSAVLGAEQAARAQSLAPANSPASTDSSRVLGTESPTPATNGRKIIQSAELDLAAAPDKIDQVSQEVFNVVGAAGGIVDHSSVTQTGGQDGYASFQLRIPSGVLAQTLAHLSNLAGAQVMARTDNTQDVNTPWISAHRQLADDRALRSALLKQLAAATTTGAIDSLKVRIHDAEMAIAADEANLNSLNAQINYSKVVVTINARPVPPAATHHHSSGGLTLGHSAHIAGRVLVVAAGIALIVLAGLVPVGLLAALGAWIAVTVRRRRREQALDVA